MTLPTHGQQPLRLSLPASCLHLRCRLVTGVRKRRLPDLCHLCCQPFSHIRSQIAEAQEASVMYCSGVGGNAQYQAGRLLTASAPQQSMAELMAEIAANEYAASGGGGPLVQRAAQVITSHPGFLAHGHSGFVPSVGPPCGP
jgi:hypothetical protein